MDSAPTPAAGSTAPPPSRPQAFRRPHHKSRLGCVQCKQRKIKCDENKPSCDKCTRYNTPCSFLGLQASRPTLEAPQTGTSSPKTSPYAASVASSHGSPFSSPSVQQTPNSVFPISLTPNSEAFTMLDLEFLHFYTTSTWYSISSLKIFQYAVPQMAFTHPFLMHGILALSALHLAHLRPEKSQIYIIASDAHHQQAIVGYRDALSSITPQNCHACAAFSLLLNVYAWASPDRPGSLFLTDEGEDGTSGVELITILRGGNAVMAAHRAVVAEGPLRPLYQLWFGWNEDQEKFARLPSVASLLSRNDDSPILPHEDDARLEALAALWDPPNAHVDVQTAEVLSHTLKLLRRTFVVSSADNGIEDQQATLGWPIMIPEQFLGLVQARNPRALVLLAHYCLLLKRSDSRWWIEGKAETLLGRILKAVGEPWKDWIDWPLTEVGTGRGRVGLRLDRELKMEDV